MSLETVLGASPCFICLFICLQIILDGCSTSKSRPDFILRRDSSYSYHDKFHSQEGCLGILFLKQSREELTVFYAQFNSAGVSNDCSPFNCIISINMRILSTWN